jgi:type III secretion system low calcium response chaperone LcrH/SycD
METSVGDHTSDHVKHLTSLLELSTTIKEGNPSTPSDIHNIGTPPPSFFQDSLEALYTLAYDFYSNGKYQDAQECFRLLTLSNSLERRYWMGLGACCQLLKQYREALDCYSAAAFQDSSDPHVHRHAADCLFHLGEIQEAREALNSALAAAKNNPSHHALIPQLTLLADTWSQLSHGVSNG